MKILHNNLKNIRLIRGLEQEDLATLSGVSQTVISLAENGIRSISNLARPKLAKALNCTQAQLLGEESLDSLHQNKAQEPTNNLRVVSENKYPIKDKYIDIAMRVIDGLVNAEELTEKGRQRLFIETYQEVCDLYEGRSKESFEKYAKEIKEIKRKSEISESILKIVDDEK